LSSYVPEKFFHQVRIAFALSSCISKKFLHGITKTRIALKLSHGLMNHGFQIVRVHVSPVIGCGH
jgi:hypothetical protein